MTQQEFEIRIGQKVTYDEYERIERIYLSLPLMNKDEFCKNWKKVDNNPIVIELSEYVWNLIEKLSDLQIQMRELRRLEILKNSPIKDIEI